MRRNKKALETKVSEAIHSYRFRQWTMCFFIYFLLFILMPSFSLLHQICIVHGCNLVSNEVDIFCKLHNPLNESLSMHTCLTCSILCRYFLCIFSVCTLLFPVWLLHVTLFVAKHYLSLNLLYRMYVDMDFTVAIVFLLVFAIQALVTLCSGLR